ncbi:tRNA dimethylallyltransferase [Erysiphe neolycopersici]|uniref:tRNA dimethylallyltransferase n=1 Tax=Erysiphe neolycopersici TaxID=212602 RepID=A0A420HTT5_9PEZI|nr:tRNA dimethylallyltransferase [Erysiphe neolycopersici]
MASRIIKEPIIFVMGATGTGKSMLAVDLAKRFNGEIINSDAMQMYAGLPITTNKITYEEQQGIPHHLLGNIQIDEEAWRIGVFQRQAKIIIRQIRDRGKVPIVVGGTHYYIHSLLFGDSIIGENEGDDSNFQLDKEILDEFPILNGSPELILKKLREVDPLMADRWHPNDTRKITRSLMIYLKTGEKASDLYARQQEYRDKKSQNMLNMKTTGVGLSPESTLLFWIYAEPEMLKNRLDDRVLKMIEAGLLNEVESMEQYLQKQLSGGIKIDTTRGIWTSIGWKEFESYRLALKTGTDLENAINFSIQKTQVATRQYAKRQLRWIRLKLRPALAQNRGWNERLYLLDGSNASNFREDVIDLAIKITAKFLLNQKLSLPQEISSTAKRVLACEDKKPDVWFRRTCDTCLITSMNEIEWDLHLRSRKHRGLVKKKLKVMEMENSRDLRLKSSFTLDDP